VSKVKLLYGAIDVIEASSNRVIGILRSQVARLEACSRISGPESAAAGSDPTQSLGPDADPSLSEKTDPASVSEAEPAGSQKPSAGGV
jgi:hypothetical protein